MKKRTDRKIAIGGSAVAAVLLPTVMVALAQTGWGRTSHGRPDAAAGGPMQGTEAPGSFNPETQPSIPATTLSPSSTPTPTVSGRPVTGPLFSTGGSKLGTGDPDTRSKQHGKKAQLPSDAISAPTKYRKADDGAKITALTKVSSTQFDLTIASPALGASVKTRVMIPKSWKAKAKRTWPVVYAYHGGSNNYLSWTKNGNIAQVAAGYDLMVVMPEGGSNGSYTDWYNGGKGGIPGWETFHIREVIPLMERNFHAGSVRAAIGLSSGGQGSITYAERYPGLFKYAASYSGALNITAPGMPTILTSINRTTAIWGEPTTDRAIWDAHDGTAMASRLRGTGVYVSSGNGKPGPYDNPNAQAWEAGRFSETLSGQMNTNFVQAAKRAGVPITANLYGPGTHSWKYWKREVVRSWPLIVAAIGAKKS